MSKVKKGAGLTGVRNLDVSRSAAGRSPRTVAKAASRGKAAPRRPTAATTASRAPQRGIRKAVKQATKPVAKKATKAVARKVTKATKVVAKKATLKVVGGQGGRPGRLAPIVRFDVKALDPLRKCGPGTSVQFLYLVQESVEGKRTPHLVFFDRHGWYCEHGRTCPAVAPAKKFNGHIARVS